MLNIKEKDIKLKVKQHYNAFQPYQLQIYMILAVAAILFFTGYGNAATEQQNTLGVDKALINKSYGQLPLHFIKNDGQLDSRVKYYERGSGHITWFTEDGIYLRLTKRIDIDKTEEENTTEETFSETIKLGLIGSNPSPEIIAEGLQGGKINYLVGNDKSEWTSPALVDTFNVIIPNKWRCVYVIPEVFSRI